MAHQTESSVEQQSQNRTVAVVTGAGRGIGAAIAARLLQDGWYVVAVDRDPALLEALKAHHEGAQLEVHELDVTDRESVLARFQEVDARLGRIDAVVNNAMRIHYSTIAEMTEEALDGMYAIAVKAMFWTTQAVQPIMERLGGGVIVNFSSPAATRGMEGTSAYSAVKGAVSSFTWQAAGELGPLGIRVNGIIPGAVPTLGAKQLVDEDGYELRRRMSPLGRLGTEEEVAAGVAFLVSPSASYVTGHLLAVTGGL